MWKRPRRTMNEGVRPGCMLQTSPFMLKAKCFFALGAWLLYLEIPQNERCWSFVTMIQSIALGL